MDDDADISPTMAGELRNMLAVAAALRRLAQDAPVSEASLYVAAANSLARRAARMAGLFPDPLEEVPREPAALYRPVDLHI
jgi:hypothetical protein